MSTTRAGYVKFATKTLLSKAKIERAFTACEAVLRPLNLITPVSTEETANTLTLARRSSVFALVSISIDRCTETFDKYFELSQDVNVCIDESILFCVLYVLAISLENELHSRKSVPLHAECTNSLTGKAFPLDGEYCRFKSYFVITTLRTRTVPTLSTAIHIHLF